MLACTPGGAASLPCLLALPPPARSSSLPASLACATCCSKNAALYACYTLVIAFSAAVALGVLLSCPGLVKGCTAALLLLILLTWASVAASTAGLKIGSDG